MKPTDFRALCAELLVLAEESISFKAQVKKAIELIDRARAELAKPQQGVTSGGELQWPASVAQGCHEAAVEAEMGSPLQQLMVAAGDLLESYATHPAPQQEVPSKHLRCTVDSLREIAGSLVFMEKHSWALQLTAAAELLEGRHSHPAPVPVAEGLPGEGDWVQHCYAGVRVWQHGIHSDGRFFIGSGPESQPATHWALPLPEPQP